ncbi:30S ribosomal protein S21 [Candidatus Beckwithbacteria bacterium]|nr:30S ribosomal protein S21 [Candidatus Beckwithbacteria bacterium]
MATIVVAGPQDNNDQVIKKFKKKILQEDLLTELKDREFYRKPSEIRKEKKNEYRRRRKRRLAAKRS